MTQIIVTLAKLLAIRVSVLPLFLALVAILGVARKRTEKIIHACCARRNRVNQGNQVGANQVINLIMLNRGVNQS